MSQVLIVVDRLQDWSPFYPSERVVTVSDYLTGRYADGGGRLQVVNLCGSYRYQGAGYYCSLLAEARGHRVIPSVTTINDLARKSVYMLSLTEVEVTLERLLRKGETEREEISFTICFGEVAEPSLVGLARQIFEELPCPILQVTLRRRKKSWELEMVKAADFRRLDESQEDLFANALDRFAARLWRRPARRTAARYDLAILVDPEEKLPPSNRTALKKFKRAARALDMDAELIDRTDFARLAEFDALFIRETTAVNHHTYRFARKAEREGLVVIDDPGSILRCTNKIYLAELLGKARIPAPRTWFIYRDRPDEYRKALDSVTYPLVLKVPDGAFSRGMNKVENREELEQAIAGYFRHSFLVLGQEFMYTDYDWRVGLLNGEPLFACRYFMSPGHWQIYRHGSDGRVTSGEAETVPVEKVPTAVLRTAVRAARLIGDGLYGVDLKQCGERVVVMEVNDNPNIDAGIEDLCTGEALYRTVMGEFLRRLERMRERSRRRTDGVVV